ncbi:MAG: hypothetical protein H7Z19_23110 [Chitinophagaceae bacterium]|nr:hypothetical protein [Rubrivivax sp.]
MEEVLQPSSIRGEIKRKVSETRQGAESSQGSFDADAQIVRSPDGTLTTKKSLLMQSGRQVAPTRLSRSMQPRVWTKTCSDGPYHASSFGRDLPLKCPAHRTGPSRTALVSVGACLRASSPAHRSAGDPDGHHHQPESPVATQGGDQPSSGAGGDGSKEMASMRSNIQTNQQLGADPELQVQNIE